MVRGLRFLAAALLAALLAALPMVTHATTYRHFRSAPLHFSIDYPATWVIHYSKADGYESFNQSNSAALTVNYHAAAGFTIKSFTGKLVASFHSLGIKPSTPKYSGNTATFHGTGKLAGYHVELAVVALVNSHGAFSLSMAAPPAQFTRLQPTYLHMLHSFNTM